MLRRCLLFLGVLSLTLAACTQGFADRDWEYWSQESISIPVSKKINWLILPEWRFKEDMHNVYLFKLETAPSFTINKYLEIAPYYVYQEKKSGAIWDRSDLMYFDTTIKLPLEGLFDIKVSDRVRYQYDFDKAKTTLRNSLKISKAIKLGKFEISPYLSEEPFYDAKQDRITEHRTCAGLTYTLSKNASIGAGYMVNSKKGRNDWAYTNVLVTNLNIKF